MHLTFHPVVLFEKPPAIFNLSDPSGIALAETLTYGIGRYNEHRPTLYSQPLFETGRSIHMGIDFFAPAATPLFSIYDGTVLFNQHNKGNGNYGPTLVIEYSLEDLKVYALYGHLNRKSVQSLPVGTPVSRGQQIARIGNQNENGGWRPHLHFQLSLLKPETGDLPGVVHPKDLKLSLLKYPDPRILLGPLY